MNQPKPLTIMPNWMKRLFCKHKYIFHRNIYGDEIICVGYKRSVWKCTKCGRYQYAEKLFDIETEKP